MPAVRKPHNTQDRGSKCDKKREYKFMWSPKEYSEVAVVANDARVEMLSRLQWMVLQPKVILDVGCGAGEGSVTLQQCYPDARVFALDLSAEMLAHAKVTNDNLNCVHASAYRLPFANQSVDLLFANFLMPWCGDMNQLLREWHRVLRPEGLLLFTAFGPDTLKEWRHVFAKEDTPIVIDMHDLGDALVQAGFAEPVVDVDSYTLSYRDQTRCLDELIKSGMWMPKGAIEIEAQAVLEVTYEVVYAHAFAPTVGDHVAADAEGVARIPLASLRRQLEKR